MEILLKQTTDSSWLCWSVITLIRLWEKHIHCSLLELWLVVLLILVWFRVSSSAFSHLPRQEMDSLQRQMEEHTITVHESLSSWAQVEAAPAEHAHPRGDTKLHNQNSVPRDGLGQWPLLSSSHKYLWLLKEFSCQYYLFDRMLWWLSFFLF